MSKEGKITRDELVKAFSDPALIETFRNQSKEINTISGAWQVFQNQLVLIVGEMNKSSDATGFLSSAIKVLSQFVAFLADVFVGAIRGIKQFGASLTVVFKDIQTVLRLMFIQTGGIAALNPFSEEGEKLRANMKAQYDAILQDRRGFVQAANDDLEEFMNSNNTKFRDMLNGVGSDDVSGGGGTAGAIKSVNELTDAQMKAAKKSAEYKRKLMEELDAITYKIETDHADAIKIYREKRLKEEYETKQKWVELEQKRAIENFKEAQDAHKKFEDERRREFEKTTDAINNIFREGFANLVNGGISTWKSFTKSLITTFKTAVADQIYKLLAQPFVVKLVASVLGIGGAGNALASSASGLVAESGGFGNLLGGFKDIIGSLNGSLVGSIENLGVFLSTGNGGLGDMIGGALGQYAGQIADVLPYAGAALQLLSGDVKGAAFTAAGTAIGSLWGPIGGAIGGALGSVVGGLFGGSKPRAKVFGSASSSTYEGGQLTSQVNPLYGTSKRYVPLGADNTLNSLNLAFSSTLGALLREFGLSDRISTHSTVAQRKKTALATFNGAGFSYYQGGDRDAQQAFNEMMEVVLSKGIVVAINNSSLPKTIKELFDGLTSKETVADAVVSIINMRDALVDLPPVFDAVRNVVNGVAGYKTTIEQLKAQFAATQTFVNLFYSDSEKLGITYKQLTTQFSALNLAVPDSRDAFRALVESIDVVDAATRDQFNALLALSPVMSEYFNLLQQQADGINEVNQALADGLNQNLFSTYADFASARANAMAGNNPSIFMANRPASNDAEIIALKESQAEMKVYLQAIVQNTAGTEKILKRFNGDGLPPERTAA